MNKKREKMKIVFSYICVSGVVFELCGDVIEYWVLNMDRMNVCSMTLTAKHDQLQHDPQLQVVACKYLVHHLRVHPLILHYIHSSTNFAFHKPL